ncbi:MAG: glycerophosphoryl diester phosphodiesterase membrane domain-containing protein [Kouleothrix sp.]|nr:glycerophosphoryl diester phosphodiesterase membrane domain-containing protein [Kouleothrix sp.]
MDQPVAATPRLRPMSLGDMFDAAFRLYRQHFLTFIGITALLYVPVAILQLGLQLGYGSGALENWMRFATRPPTLLPGQSIFDVMPLGEILTFIGLSMGLGVLQFLLVQNLITGALANAVARSYTGQPVSILDAYRLGWRRFLSLIGASLATLAIGMVALTVIFGCTFGLAFVLLGSATGSRSSSAGVLAGVAVALAMLGLLLLLGLASLFFYTRLIVTTQAIVLEDRGPLSGLGRSWRLISGSFWRTLAIAVLMYILAYIIAGIPSALVSFVLQLLSANSLGAIMRNQAIVTLVATLGQIVILPLQLVIFTLLYYDLRVRKEGYDLELIAQSQQVTAP